MVIDNEIDEALMLSNPYYQGKQKAQQQPWPFG